jgi:hypothetical protein
MKEDSGSKPKNATLAVNVSKDAPETPAPVKDASAEAEGQG